MKNMFLPQKLKIHINPLTVPLLVIFGFCGTLGDYIPVFISIIIHEAAHMVCAITLGEEIEKVSITPWGCMLHLKYAPLRENAFPIYISGAVMSLILAALTPWRAVNISLAAFNLFPAPPLDGGKIISTFFGYRTAELIGSVCLIFLCVFCGAFAIPSFLPPMLYAIILFPDEEKELNTMRRYVKITVEKSGG